MPGTVPGTGIFCYNSRVKFREILRDRRTWLYAFIALTVIIGYLSLVKAPTVRIGLDVRNRTMHFLAYFIYSTVIAMWRNFTNGEEGKLRSFGQAGVVSVVYGSVLEWLQMYIPGRDSDPVDAVFNAMGGIVGAWFGSFYLYRRISAKSPDATYNQ